MLMITRSLDKARDAYLKRDAASSRFAHMRGKNESAPEKHKTAGAFIKSAVYGGLDGTITTYAVVAGSQGASLHSGVVLILGLANLFGDGLSMAIGDYLSTKSENEYHAAEREREKWEVENFPQGERREMLELYMAKGMSEKDAGQMVKALSKNKKAWIDVMMVEELGILESTESPLKNAYVTFFSFVVFGFVPIVTYIISSMVPSLGKSTFLIATALTLVTLFSLGAAKTRVTGKHWLGSGIEMVVVGGIASFAAYVIGYLLQGLA